jgi:mannose-1-phosphate guanylyltransferase
VLAAFYTQKHHGDDAVMLVLPADHLIRDQAAFAAAVMSAAARARAGALVTFGISPTHPETGFGYIECGESLGDTAANEPPGFCARRFVEKPPLAQAHDYLAAGNYVWNSGMFCFTATAILAAFTRHAPAVLDAIRPVWSALAAKSASSMQEIDTALFAAVPDISLDYAVMEKAAARGDVTIVRGTFDWSDVGSWQAVSDLTEPDDHGNRGQGDRITIATRGTYVHSDNRVVATVGVENLVIIDTPDAVLVAHRDHLQRVKEVVSVLKARGHDAYRMHRTVARPWGAYTVLQDGPQLQDQAHRGEARCRTVAAAPSSAQRTLGGRLRHGRGDSRRRDLPHRRQRIDVHPGGNETSSRKCRQGTAGDDRSAMRRLSRRRRHRRFEDKYGRLTT